MNAPKSVEYTRDQLVELFTEHASDGWSGDAAALSPEQAADAILALSGPVSGMDTSSVAGVPSSQEGSDHQGLTPLEKELVEVLNDIAKYAFQTGNGVPSIGHAACLADIARRAKDAVAAVNERAAIAKAEATATEAQHAGQWVPLEPTEAMVEAYCRKLHDLGFTAWVNLSAVWGDVLAAAAPPSPAPPSSERDRSRGPRSCNREPRR